MSMKFYFRLEDIKYAKIYYQNGNGEYCNTKAAIKRIDAREVFACAKFEDGLYINVPQIVMLSIICGDGIYKTKTKLKSVDNEEPYTFFALETPQGIDYEQNREYFRVTAKYDCIYKIEQDGDEKEFAVQTTDISANGVSFVIPEHTISESSSDLMINIDNRQINVKVRYIRSEKVASGYRISFTYARISDADRDYISQVCLKKQLEERRNSLR